MRKISNLLLAVPLVSAFFVSCKDEATPPARLLVANAAITAPVGTGLPTAGPAIDIRWNGRLVFNNVVYGAASVNTGTPITTITNPTAVNANYNPVESGTFGLNFAAAGSAGTTIFNRNVSMLPGRNYTAMAIDLTPFYRTLIMEDDLTDPPAGKVKVRFVHAIPQALLGSLPRRDTVDVIGFGGSLGPTPTALFANRTFADAVTNNRLHQFALLDSGTYTIGVRIAGTPGVSQATGLIGAFPNQRLLSGKIYTFVARIHFPTLTTAPAGLTAIVHN